MEYKIKHLEFIQGIINRLSTNSFLLKGWSVLLVAALLGVGTQSQSTNLICLALIPVGVLWGLDGYFLWQERTYRRLYDDVRARSDEDVDFSMSTDAVQAPESGWLRTTFSKTLIAFHGVLVMATIGVLIVEIIQMLNEKC